MDAFYKAYQTGLEAFFKALQRAENDDAYKDGAVFITILQLGFTHFGLKPKDLVKDKKIVRSYISKWKHGDNLPINHTRKIVVMWMLNELDEQLLKIKRTVA